MPYPYGAIVSPSTFKSFLAAASSSISPVFRLSVCVSVCVSVCALRFVGHFSESKLRVFFEISSSEISEKFQR